MASNAPYSSLRLVQLDHIIENLAEEAYKDLQTVVANLQNQPDASKKRTLLLHLAATKQRLHRLHVLVQWCHKSPAVAECKRVLEVSAAHASAFRDAADQLAYLHGELTFTKAPAYDIPTAMHVLRHGTYAALPRIIESDIKAVAPGAASEALSGKKEGRKNDGNGAIRRLDFLMRAKLMEEGLPAGMRVLKVGGGEATVGGSVGQYTATLSLVPAPSDDVTVAKWEQLAQGFGDAGGGAAAAGGLEEVGTEKMEVDAAADDKQAPKKPIEASQWRWRLLSFSLLPSQRETPLPPPMVPWLARNVEERMWAAGDVQQLVRLGKGDLIAVPPPPMTRRQRAQRQRALDDAVRAAPGLKLPPGAGTSSGPLNSSQQQQTATSGGPSASAAVAASGAAANGEVGAPGVIPSWAQSSLAALHAVMQQTSAKLALGSILLDEARALEAAAAGPWGGGRLRVDKLPDSFGVRLEAWPKVPLLSFEEVATAGGAAADARINEASGARGAVRALGWALDVQVPDGGDGTIACACTPPLRSPASGEAVVLSPSSAGVGLSAERLLLAAGARHAALQLAGVRRLVSQRGQRLEEALGADWTLADLAVPLTTAAEAEASIAVPTLQCSSGGAPVLLLSLSLADGEPQLTLAPVAVEADAALAADSLSIVARAQGVLNRRLQAVLAQTLDVGTSRAGAWAGAVGEAVVDTWRQLGAAGRKAALAATALQHKLPRTPLPRVLEGVELGVSDDEAAAGAAPLLVSQETTLALKAPGFATPRLKVLTHSVPMGRRGGLVGFVLADVGARGPPRRWSLALCWATPRGVPTALRRLVAVPPDVLNGSEKRQARGGGASKRKRGSAADSDGDGAADGEPEINWALMRQWCLAITAAQQIEAQLDAAGLEAAPTSDRQAVAVELGGTWLAGPGLLKDPGHELLAGGEEVVFTLTSEAAAGSNGDGVFIAALRGGALGDLDSEHVKYAQKSADGGLELRRALGAGDSAAAVAAAAAGALRARACAQRLAAAAKARGKQPPAAAVQAVSMDKLILKAKGVGSSGSSSGSVTLCARWGVRRPGSSLSNAADTAKPAPAAPSGGSVRAAFARAPVTTKAATGAAAEGTREGFVCSLTTEPVLATELITELELRLERWDESGFLDVLGGGSR